MHILSRLTVFTKHSTKFDLKLTLSCKWKCFVVTNQWQPNFHLG